MAGTFSSAIGQFDIGQSPIQGYLLPPAAAGAVQKIIPAYLYEQYQDDADLQAFFRAYNEIAQEYLDWFKGTFLGLYVSDAISGPLLDWVGVGVYGIARPALASGRPATIGPLNTFTANELGPNEIATVSAGAYVATSDDIYKRVLTWNLYKGDGNRFTISWLKRRVLRFLTGANGLSPAIDTTYDISVTFAGNNTVYVIILGDSYPVEVISALIEGVNSKILQTPFQYHIAVLFGGSGFGGFGDFAFDLSAFGG